MRYNHAMRSFNILEEDTYDFLRDGHTAVVATCLDSTPHATTVYYDIDKDFNFYYLTKRNTQKNIQTAFNPRVSLVVGTGPEHITVQARGRAEVLTDLEKEEAIDRMILRYTEIGVSKLPIQYMENLKDQAVVAYKVIPSEIMFMNMDCEKYRRSMSHSYHQII
jgi:uncharacterized protein YhbP (UPF0306 family)